MAISDNSADVASTRPGGEADAARRPGLRDNIAENGILYALVVLLALLCVVGMLRGQPFYLRPQNVANILQQAAPFALLVVFETIVLISRNFDISIGSNAALCALAVILLSGPLGIPLAILIALVIGGAVGVLNGVLVEKVGVNSFIVTLGMLTAVRGLVIVITGGNSIGASTETGDALAAIYYTAYTTPNLLLWGGLACLALLAWGHFRAGGAHVWSPVRIALAVAALAALVSGFFVSYQLKLLQPVWFTMVVAVAAWWVMGRTTLGRRIYAVGGNDEAARLSGIRVVRHRIGAFAALGIAAGLAGTIFATQLGSLNPTGLSGIEFTVLTAAILGGTGLFGGTGNVLKSVAGALFLFTLINGFNAINLGANYQSLVEGTVILVAAIGYSMAARRR